MLRPGVRQLVQRSTACSCPILASASRADHPFWRAIGGHPSVKIAEQNGGYTRGLSPAISYVLRSVHWVGGCAGAPTSATSVTPCLGRARLDLHPS